MNLRSIISLLPFLITALSIVVTGVCLFLLFKVRARLQTLVVALNYADSEIVDLGKDLDRLSKRSGELARRVSALELKRPADPEESDFEVAGLVPARLTITERRHRIRVLARKGKNAESIAATLGMPYGEVQLIMGLTANA